MPNFAIQKKKGFSLIIENPLFLYPIIDQSYNPNHLNMPKVGIEPTFLSEHDFESCVSACSTTSAQERSIKQA